MPAIASAIPFLSTAKYVDSRLETEDWRSFLLATQIVEILFALISIEFVSVIGTSLLPSCSAYIVPAIICLSSNIFLLVFIWKSRFFVIDSKFRISVRSRVKLAGNGIVVCLYAMACYSTLQCGVFSAGFCSLFALPLVAIAATGSKNSCLFFGTAVIFAQQYAVVLQGLGYQWPRSIVEGTTAINLLIINAFLCIILNIFIIEISVRFCLSHKRVNDVMQATTNKVRQLLDEKVNFIANATHELRTPVMQILGLVELLSSVNKERETMALIDTLRSATMGVIALVNDVLDYEKLGKGMVKLEQSPFDIRELVKRLFMMSAFQAHSKQIELMAVTSKRVPDVVIGDQMRLYQILQNLMSNAIKFTVPREQTNEIIVKVECYPIANDTSQLQLDISVRDTGIGLSRDSIPYLFQAFHQVSSSTTRIYGGTGLGLAISRNLARVMNGDIVVDSEGPGKGTVFNVTLQVGVQAADSESTRGSFPTYELGWIPLPGIGTIAIFDDVPTALSILDEVAQQLGFDVRGFTSFSSMMQFLSSTTSIPKLIMVDVGTIGASSDSIPGFTRLELIRNANQAFARLPVIALKDQDDILTPSSPFTTYYSKPIIAEQIQITLLSVLSLSNRSSDVNIKVDSSPSPQPQSRHLRVLLVDDNTVNLKIVGRMMEQLGHEVTLCSSGSSALNILHRSQLDDHIAGQVEDTSNENPIDIIITDFMMPEMDGLQLVNEIRRQEHQRPGSRVIPIILTSGNPRSAFQKELASFELTYFMMKPFTIGELQKNIENCCGESNSPARTIYPKC